jgi:type I restriction enzyme S subunit
MVISLPTVEQQRKIADFLDTESLRIDALATKKRLLEQMLADRMLATIEQFIWGQNFALAPLRRIAQFVDYRGATPSKSSSGVPLITASHVKEGMLDFESEPQWVDENTYKDWMRRGWPATGDVLLTTEAPLGKVAQITNHQVALAQRIVLLKPMARGTLADFLAYALRSPSFQHQLMANATGSTALGIKADRLKGLRIPVPSLEIQRAYARTLYEKASVIASSRQKLMAQVDLLHEHLQRVTTAAITGEMEIAEARQ